jgi:hypothetical protein
VSARARLSAVLLTALVLAVAMAAVALGVAPKKGKAYSGSGKDYWNNAPHLHAVPGKRQKVSFRVSKDGQEILKFSGAYEYYCGAGHGSITANKLVVTSRGTFGGTGTRPATAFGKRTGTDYLAVSGKFIDGGRKAKLSYLFNFVANGHKAPKNPFAIRYRSTNQTCESIVRATVKVR